RSAMQRAPARRTEPAADDFCIADFGAQTRLEPDCSAHRPQIVERRRRRAEHPSLTEQFQDIRGVEAPLDQAAVLESVADTLANEYTVERVDVADPTHDEDTLVPHLNLHPCARRTRTVR